MLDYLIGLISRMGHWGYLVIFFGALLESAAFLGVLVPGESLVLVAGFLSAQKVLDLDALIVIIAVGATVGDSIGYEIGRRMGRPALLRIGGRLGLSERKVDKADKFFERHGGKAIFLGRFVGFARALVPFLAGSSNMPYARFLPYNVAGAVLWSILMTLLGYFLGASWTVAAGWIGRASAIVAGIVVVILVLAWLWHWAARHEETVRAVWQRVRTQPWINALGSRLEPVIIFLRTHLSLRGYLGLQLGGGALVLLVAGWIFGGLAEDVATGDPITKLDLQIAAWLHAHASPLLTDVMTLVSSLHGTIPISIATLFLAVVWSAKRHWYWLANLLLIIPGGMLINVATKYAFHRTRPTFDDAFTTLAGYSFPSGHTAASTLLYGVLAAFAVATGDRWSRRVWAILPACAMVAVVAFSRLYLGAHYLTDVLAAIAEASAWLALCLTGTRIYWQRKEVN